MNIYKTLFFIIVATVMIGAVGLVPTAYGQDEVITTSWLENPQSIELSSIEMWAHPDAHNAYWQLPDPLTSYIGAVLDGSKAELIGVSSNNYLLVRTMVEKTVVNGDQQVKEVIPALGWVSGDANKGNITDWSWSPADCHVEKGLQAKMPLWSINNDDIIEYGWLADVNLSSCDMLVEGRQELVEIHWVWLLRENPVVNTSILGKYAERFNTFFVREGSWYWYPQVWNLGNTDTPKLPVAYEMVTAKRDNQVANGYNWDIIVSYPSGNQQTFEAGGATPIFDPSAQRVAPNAQPRLIFVTGIEMNGAYVASIGGKRFRTIALFDNDQLLWWDGAVDNIVFTSVEAWRIPAAWSEEEMFEWATATFPDYDLAEMAK